MATHQKIFDGTGYTVSATEVISLGDAAPDSVGSFLVFVSSLSGTHAITPKGRPAGSNVASGEYQTLAYTVGSTGVLTAGGTAISAEGAYFVRADGMEVFLDVTVTSNSFRLDARPLRG